MEGLDDEIESILYIAREVSGYSLLYDMLLDLCLTKLVSESVYKIPPLKANEGHRAGDWGDLAAPLWKGRLRFVEKGSSGAALLFEDSTTGSVLQVFYSNNV